MSYSEAEAVKTLTLMGVWENENELNDGLRIFWREGDDRVGDKIMP